jgi:hypothetical protein
VGRRAGIACFAALYIAAWAISSLALKTNPSDLDLYFWPSAETVVGGHPLLIYAAHAHDTYPNANGPLGLLPLVPIAALANAVGWAGSLGARAAITDAVMSVFVLLLSYQTVRLVAAAHGGVGVRPAVASTMLFAPALWIAVIDYGHVEQPVELCLMLLAVGCALESQWIPAGIALGAAVLARTTAAFILIPLALLPLATRRARPAVSTVLASVVTVAAGLAPFLVADQAAVTHSLLTYRGGLPIGGGSVMIVARTTPFAGLGQHADVYLAAVIATALTALILWRRRRTATAAAGLLGLLTIATACFPLVAKTVFPYYLVEPYVFGTLWWLARPGSAFNWRAIVPLLLTADVFLAKVGTMPLVATSAVVEGVASSAMIAVVLALVTADLLRSPRLAAPGRLPVLG